MNDVKDDKAAGWEEWFRNLSPAARRALAREAPAPLVQQPGEGLPDHLGEYAYHLIVSPDGAYPRVHSFRRLIDLVRMIGRLESEGEDVAVLVVHGTFLPLTAGKPRHVLHPKRNVAVSVPVYAGERVRKVSMHLVDQRIQEHGYIGPPELLDYPMPAPREGMPESAASPASTKKAATPPSSKAVPPANMARKEPPAGSSPVRR